MGTAVGTVSARALKSELLKHVFLAAVATPTVHFCCSGTASKCRVNELGELPLLGNNVH